MRGKYKLSNVSDLLKINLKHANSKIKYFSQEIKNVTKYLQSWLIFFTCFFSEFLARRLADSLSSDVKLKLLVENNNKNYLFEMKSIGVTLQRASILQETAKGNIVRHAAKLSNILDIMYSLFS